jgi:hypothetical protein
MFEGEVKHNLKNNVDNNLKKFFKQIIKNRGSRANLLGI